MNTSDSGPTGPESSSPQSPRTCPHCGAVLPADAPEGQCPACLLLNLTLEPTAASPTQPAEPPKPPAPPLTPAALAPHFPQLEILECLGRGGMGVVYKARQKSLNRLVALKLLAPEREKDAAFAERFTREAQALALLSHSHIVTVYDFGVTSASAEGAGDGFYYLLMEYVDGVNLRQLLDQRKLTPEEALAIVPPLCDALEYAHERGIVHRDIKPENLLLDRRGQVKIADFGIAKMLGNGTPSHTMGGTPVESTPPPLGVTQPETALGTPAYMAPEQASAPERVDSRADIYSLGVVFYEMLTGQLPAKQIEARNSRLKNLHIDVRVDEIVLRALEKKPEMRWQTAAELRTRVEAVSSAPAATGPPPALPTSPPPAAALAPPSPPPFRPWMQRFVARPAGLRRGMFWGLLAVGTVLAVLFMVPVEEISFRPEGVEWKRSTMHGIPDPWFVETEQSASAPSAPGQARQLVREFRPLSVSYAAGLAAGVVWLVFWSFFAAEQRAGTRLPPGQRAFAMPLAERGEAEPGRIHWGRLLLLLLAFLAAVATLSGHMSALMMLVLHDAPNPLFNALFTAFFLSFAFLRGVAREVRGASSTPAQAAPMHHARACGPTAAAAGFVTAYVAPFLFALLGTLMTGHVRDRALISVFLVTWGVSTVVAHYLLSRRKLAEEDQRRWLRITSICGWIISLPVIGFGIFFLTAGADEGFRWTPSPPEAFIVPIICLGTVLLPVASSHLWHASAHNPHASRRAGRLALGVLLLVAAVALPVAGLMLQSLGQTRAHVVYQRERTELRKLAIQGLARLEGLQEAQRALQAEQLRAQDLAKQEELSRAVAEHEKKIAGTRASVEQLQQKEARLTLPRVPVVPLAPALFGSLLCVFLAVLLFRRATAAVGLQLVHVIMVLTLLVIGYAVVGLSRARTAATVGSMGAAPPGGTAMVYDGVLLHGASVEHLPGTRHVRLHFTRWDNSNLGLETAQDINLAPDGKGPAAAGTPGWKLTHWVGPEGPHILAWTLPAEFSDADMEDLVRQLRKDWLRERALPSGGVPVFARVKHRDGWVCTLLARVKQSPGAGSPQPATTPGPGMEIPSTGALAPPPPPSASASGLGMDPSPGLPGTAGMPAANPSASETPRMQPADPPVMDTSDAALRTLSWHTFDQTPGQYWRQLADVRRFREAAELIERYLALHPELGEGPQQINGANLHFHAAQCHASARNKEEALEHLKKAVHPMPSPIQDSHLWNYYVSATMFFLIGERDGMLSAYEELAKKAAFTHPNLLTLDRLLAGFGKPYADAYGYNDGDDHKKLSADRFNRAWELLDRKTRSPEEDAQMLSYAHTSLAHWRQREDCKPRNLSIGYWQISRVYSVVKEKHGAQVFAQLCLDVSAQEPPFYLGYAHEAMARAALLRNDSRTYQTQLGNARAQAAKITDAGERKMLEKDLDDLETLAAANPADPADPAASPGASVPGLPPP